MPPAGGPLARREARLKSLYLRVWLTVVAVLALFAIGSGWLVQRHMERERGRVDALAAERVAAWADLIQRSLPGAEAAPEEQAEAVLEWSQRLRMPLALDDARGRRIVATVTFERRAGNPDAPPPRIFPIRFADGRTLWVMRPVLLRLPRSSEGLRVEGPRPEGLHPGRVQLDALRFRGVDDDFLLPPSWFPFAPPGWGRGVGMVAVLAVLFAAIAIGAFPVVRRLTRRLEALKQGVERFGSGALHHRVDEGGRDEVAAVAASFNRAAERIEGLVKSNQSLLANASHELRSPLARLKMAVSLLDNDAACEPVRREQLRREIHTNIAELDALVEEVLMASRLDAQAGMEHEPVELVGLGAEEAARLQAEVQAPDGALTVRGDERLLRRAIRNLLENARRYGGDEVELIMRRTARGVELRVCDRGPGVPENMRERIFEPFFRLPGHAERAGGVGLGLSLVRQIAERHGGGVRCEAREGGGSCFVIDLPAGA
ncbi:HAMP domain-containing sensor histidine kinase [Aquincola sp. MAHUQ-54]|uniref:histidine kinase n=1 Tax=Aquincola agrisoli TaxID=3119538 RepID=A0AAW9QE64_9BURK